MAEPDTVPYTLFDAAVFADITESDFMERLTFKTLQSAGNHTKAPTGDSSAAFCHLFDVSLRELTKLQAQVDRDLQEEEARLARLQEESQRDLAGAQEDTEALLHAVKATHTNLGALAGELVTVGQIRTVQEHIQRAETVGEVMDHFAAFCAIRGSPEVDPDPDARAPRRSMDEVLERLQVRAKAHREAAVVVEQAWQARHKVSGGGAASFEMEEDSDEELDAGGGEDEDETDNPLPGIYSHVTDKPSVAKDVLKLLMLTGLTAEKGVATGAAGGPGLRGSVAENNGVRNVQRYANWLQNELVEDCFCYVDCYESFLRFARQSGALKDVIRAKELPHGRKLLRRLGEIPDAVASLGSPDALFSRYINKCFVEINTNLPENPKEATLEDVKGVLDAMVAKCEYESPLVHDVFHPSGLAVMHRLLARFAEETIGVLVQAFLEKAAIPEGLLDENVSLVRAAKIANSRIHAVFAKDRPEAEVQKEKYRILLLNYRGTYELVHDYLNSVADLHRLCGGWVRAVAPHAGGTTDWLSQAVDEHFAHARARCHDWEVLALKMYSFYHIATAPVDEEATPFASYSTLVYLTNATEAAMDRLAQLSPPLSAARSIAFLALLLLQYACLYIKACVQAAASHLKDALKRLPGPIVALQPEAPGDDLVPLSIALVREKPHSACLRVVAWAHQSVVKLDRYEMTKVEPLLQRLGSGDVLGHREGKKSLLGDVEREVAAALRLACLLMGQTALQILLTHQQKHDFKISDKHPDAPDGGCSTACRMFEAELLANIEEVNAHLDGANRVAFAEALAAILFEGLCAHFRSFTVNDAGALTLRADVSVYATGMERLQIPSVTELFKSLRYLSDLIIVSKAYLCEFVDTNPPPPPFTAAHLIDYLKTRTDITVADIQMLSKRWDLKAAPIH